MFCLFSGSEHPSRLVYSCKGVFEPCTVRKGSQNGVRKGPARGLIYQQIHPFVVHRKTLIAVTLIYTGQWCGKSLPILCSLMLRIIVLINQQMYYFKTAT